MKKFLVTNKKTQEICGKFDSKSEAAEEMQNFIEEHNEDVDSDDEEYLAPFDFTLEEIEIKEANECITDFEKARLVNDINPKHVKALIALNELFTIAQAWNKEDGFTPDFSNKNQTKWFPWFVYSDEAAGFVYAATNNAAT